MNTKSIWPILFGAAIAAFLCRSCLSQDAQVVGLPTISFSLVEGGKHKVVVTKSRSPVSEDSLMRSGGLALLGQNSIVRQLELTTEQLDQFDRLFQELVEEAEKFPLIDDISAVNSDKELNKQVSDFYDSILDKYKKRANEILLPHQFSFLEQRTYRAKAKLKSFLELITNKPVPSLAGLSGDDIRQLKKRDEKITKPEVTKRIAKAICESRRATISAVPFYEQDLIAAFGKDFFDPESFDLIKAESSKKDFGMPVLKSRGKSKLTENVRIIPHDLKVFTIKVSKFALLADERILDELELSKQQKETLQGFYARWNKNLKKLEESPVNDWNEVQANVSSEYIQLCETTLRPRQQKRLAQLYWQEYAKETNLWLTLKVLKGVPLKGDDRFRLKEKYNETQGKLAREVAEIQRDYRNSLIKILNNKQRESLKDIFGSEYFESETNR